MVSRALLEELDLRSELGSGPVLLRAHTPDSSNSSAHLAPKSARRIIATLAAAVEDHEVEVHASDGSTRSNRRAANPGLGTRSMHLRICVVSTPRLPAALNSSWVPGRLKTAT